MGQAPLFPSLCASSLGLAVVRTRLITQLAAPGHWACSHHLQTGSARNSLGLHPSTCGRQPRVLPWPSGPFPGPAEAPRWELERGQQRGDDTNLAGQSSGLAGAGWHRSPWGGWHPPSTEFLSGPLCGRAPALPLAHCQPCPCLLVPQSLPQSLSTPTTP